MKIIKSKFKKSWKWDYCIYRNRKSTWSWMFFLSSSIYIIIIIIPKRQKKGQSDHKAIWWAIWACCGWAWPLGQGNITGLSINRQHGRDLRNAIIVGGHGGRSDIIIIVGCGSCGGGAGGGGVGGDAFTGGTHGESGSWKLHEKWLTCFQSPQFLQFLLQPPILFCQTLATSL